MLKNFTTPIIPVCGLTNGALDIGIYRSFFLVDWFHDANMLATRHIRPSKNDPQDIRSGRGFILNGMIADCDPETSIEEIIINAGMLGIDIQFHLIENRMVGDKKISSVIDLSTGENILDLKPFLV